MPEVEMLKQLAGGGGVAFALVFVFLKFMRELQASHEASLRNLTDTFNSEHAATRSAFQDQVRSMTDQLYSNQKQSQDQMNVVIAEYTQITRETVVAVKGLEAAVRDLQARIK